MLRKSVYKIGLFISILLLVNFALNSIFTTLYNSERYVSKKDALFESLKKPPKFLLIGDSHVQNSMNPQIFKNTFNYSSLNENYIQTFYKLKYIIVNKINVPEKIILPIDLSSFTYFRAERFKYDPYWIKYVDYFEVDSVRSDNDNNNNKFIKKWIGARFFSYAGQFDFFTKLLYTKETTYKDDYLGYKPRYADYSKKKDITRIIENRVKLYFPDERIFDEDMAFYFEKILKICSKNNIEVILIKMPLTKEYYEKVGERFDLADYYNKINLIARKYDNVSTISEYQTFYFNHPEYFRNPDHMNHKGATEFSKVLNKRFN